MNMAPGGKRGIGKQPVYIKHTGGYDVNSLVIQRHPLTPHAEGKREVCQLPVEIRVVASVFRPAHELFTSVSSMHLLLCALL